MSRLKSQYEANARYNRWMNERLYALAETVGDDVRKRDLGAFFGSIHGTLNHILLGDRVWLGRFGAGEPVLPKSLADELYADFAELRRERVRTDDMILAWVGSLDGEKLDAPLRYTRGGAAVEHPLWWAVGHFFNHQTHHRGQVTTLFKQLGHDPGVTDMIAFLREAGA
jgi:uncharacterized damage-inducible protein DinB